MTEKELEIAVNEHEMQRLELKEAFGAESIETACAFANAHGGYIVIGVDDQSECAKNGNAFPELSQKYGSFITVYDSRLKQATGVAGKRSPEGKFESAAGGMNGGIKGGIKSGMNGGMKSEGDTKKDVKTENAVLILLKSSSKMSIDIMASKLLLSRNAVAKQLAKLKRKGAVRRVGAANGGYWEVVSDTINEGINTPREGVNEGINGADETVNGSTDTINLKNDTINTQNDTINQEDDTIKRKLLDTIIQKEGIKRDVLAEAIQRSIPTVARLLADLENEGKIIYRGSKKTGGYYAVKKED
jgi:predicted HTH transcriptional regulator